MWQLLQKNPTYFLTFFEENTKESFYYIGVTNFQRYWTSFSSKQTFLKELKESNDGIEFDEENDLIEKSLDMLKNPRSLKSVRVTLVDNGELLNVTMRKMFEITLRIDISLLEGSPQSMFEVVVQPLLKTVCDLRSSQHELRELLMKKDREIEAYKVEGKAPRRLITTVYDDAAHMMQHTTYEEFFNAPEVSNVLKSIAFSDNPKSKPQRAPPTSAGSCNAAEHKTEPTTSQTPNGSPCENGDNMDTTKTLPKIEKCSQNTFEEADLIEPQQVEEMESERAVPSNVEVKARGDEKSPIAKKRQKKQFNY